MLIGWASDGPSIYGRYTDATQEGYDIDLDDCGGHLHGSFPYHYHPNVVQKTHAETGAKYDAPLISPLNCWKGDISQIANFWMSSQQWRSFVENVGKTENPGAPTQLNYDNSKTNPPYTPTKRSDAAEISPCCSSTEYYTAPGVELPLGSGEI